MTAAEFVPIDVEWDSDDEIPLGWVVTRGLVWSLMSGLPRASHLDVINDVAPSHLSREPTDRQHVRGAAMDGVGSCVSNGGHGKTVDG